MQVSILVISICLKVELFRRLYAGLANYEMELKKIIKLGKNLISS